MWEIEQIPDKDLVYYRVHKTWMDNNNVKPGVFRERGEGKSRGMSTDWEKYTTPHESRSRAPSSRPEVNGIIQFVVGDLRELELKVSHAPLVENRAHTNVNSIDSKKEEARLKLRDIFEWQIMPNSD